MRRHDRLLVSSRIVVPVRAVARPVGTAGARHRGVAKLPHNAYTVVVAATVDAAVTLRAAAHAVKTAGARQCGVAKLQQHAHTLVSVNVAVTRTVAATATVAMVCPSATPQVSIAFPNT
eukprot:229564-Chlamydomonas_euryale.AAC.1